MGSNMRHLAARDNANAPLRCHLSMVCQTSIRDATTSLTTYVAAQSAWRIGADTFGKGVGFESHFELTGHGEYEVRLVWLAEQNQSASMEDCIDTVQVDGTSHFLANQLRIPSGPGEYQLTLEWRRKGDAVWSDSGARYRIIVMLAESAMQPAAAPRLVS